MLADGEPIGELGAIHPKVQKAWGIPEKVYYAEINVEKLRAHKGGKRTYEPLPRFPKVPRDIAVVVDETVSAAAVKEAIEQAPAAVAIGDVELFDVYRGARNSRRKKEHGLFVCAFLQAIIRSMMTRTAGNEMRH